MTVTVKLESDDEFWARAKTMARKMDRKEPLEPEDSISIESLDELLTLLTHERIRLFRVTREQRLSLTALAVALGRDRKSVTRDVTALVDLGILRVSKESNPGHGQVGIVEPVVNELDLRISI